MIINKNLLLKYKIDCDWDYVFIKFKSVKGKIIRYRLSRPLKKIKLNVKLGKARVEAPLSPTLGQLGVSCLDFCKKFNERTCLKDIKINYDNVLVKVLFVLYFGRDFEFYIRGIHISYLFFSCLNEIELSSGESISRILLFYRLFICTCLFFFSRYCWYGGFFFENNNIYDIVIYNSFVKIFFGYVRSIFLN